MIIKTRIFEIHHGRYNNLSELAHAMGISVSQIYRVKEGKRNINQKFIIGAIKAFPEHNLDDLFYLAPESPLQRRGTKSHRLVQQHIRHRDKQPIRSFAHFSDKSKR